MVVVVLLLVPLGVREQSPSVLVMTEIASSNTGLHILAVTSYIYIHICVFVCMCVYHYFFLFYIETQRLWLKMTRFHQIVAALFETLKVVDSN